MIDNALLSPNLPAAEWAGGVSVLMAFGVRPADALIVMLVQRVLDTVVGGAVALASLVVMRREGIPILRRRDTHISS